jgi:rhodanese-related sulfurtransferase
VIIDVREPAEWSAGVAAPAVLLPLSDLRGARQEWGPFLAENRERRLLLYCAAGGRSGLAASILRREGFAAQNLGSFHRWRAAGLPVRRP